MGIIIHILFGIGWGSLIGGIFALKTATFIGVAMIVVGCVFVIIAIIKLNKYIKGIAGERKKMRAIKQH